MVGPSVGSTTVGSLRNCNVRPTLSIIRSAYCWHIVVGPTLGINTVAYDWEIVVGPTLDINIAAYCWTRSLQAQSLASTLLPTIGGQLQGQHGEHL